MISTFLEAFESSLNLIALTGLVLDACGAILVLGPDVPSISKIATAIERHRMNTLYQKLKEKEQLRGNVEPLERLFEETWIGQPVPWSVKELSIEDEAVILGAENLPDGERTRVPEEEFQNWIDNYRGIDREYYLAGGGLLLVGFLLQIVSRSASINIWAGVTVLLLTLGVGIYLLCRGKDYVWWFSG